MNRAEGRQLDRDAQQLDRRLKMLSALENSSRCQADLIRQMLVPSSGSRDVDEGGGGGDESSEATSAGPATWEEERDNYKVMAEQLVQYAATRKAGSRIRVTVESATKWALKVSEHRTQLKKRVEQRVVVNLLKFANDIYPRQVEAVSRLRRRCDFRVERRGLYRQWF